MSSSCPCHAKWRSKDREFYICSCKCTPWGRVVVDGAVSISRVGRTTRRTCRRFGSGANNGGTSCVPCLTGVSGGLFNVDVYLLSNEAVALKSSSCYFKVRSISGMRATVLTLHRCKTRGILGVVNTSTANLPFGSVVTVLLRGSRPSAPLMGTNTVATYDVMRPLNGSSGG